MRYRRLTKTSVIQRDLFLARCRQTPQFRRRHAAGNAGEAVRHQLARVTGCGEYSCCIVSRVRESLALGEYRCCIVEDASTVCDYPRSLSLGYIHASYMNIISILTFEILRSQPTEDCVGVRVLVLPFAPSRHGHRQQQPRRAQGGSSGSSPYSRCASQHSHDLSSPSAAASALSGVVLSLSLPATTASPPRSPTAAIAR